ncbi:MAG TPA: hypothetical protein VHZ29_19225 [Rhizomicrobium sp.]|nr:hypothetical protein [Rhizomicrobium sp.]
MFSQPFVTGETWSLYEAAGGKSSTLLASGNYSVGAAAQRGSKSVTAPK